MCVVVVTTSAWSKGEGTRPAATRPMIFYRKGVRGQNKKGEDIMYDIEDKINFAVFPGLQVRCPF